MRLTVGVPVYNKGEWVRECFDSILAQKYDDYEILLWDDGSTDNSGEICDEYAKRFSEKIRVIHADNKGPLIARHSIMKEAKGDYLYFIDADDELTDRDFFKEVFETIDKTGADVVAFRFCGYDVSIPPRLTKADIIRYISENKMSYSLCDKVFSRILFDKNADYSAYIGMKLGEDLMQLLDILKDARETVYIDKEYYRYRTVDNSSIHRFDWRYYDSVEAIRRKLMEYLDYCISNGSVDGAEKTELIEKIDVFTLANVTSLARKVKWVKGEGKRKVKKNYLEMIYGSSEFQETRHLVGKLPLKRRLVVHALDRKMYLLMMIAFKFF